MGYGSADISDAKLNVPDHLTARLSYEESVVSLFRPLPSGTCTPSILSVKDELRCATDEYLAESGKRVHTSHVAESAIRDRFLASEIADEPMSLSDYMRDVVPNFVRDSTRVSCSRQIGHMTGSLPNYTPPLAELVTAMNQNVVKTETSKTITLLERQVTACIHRLIYRKEEAFYAESLRNSDSTLGMFASGGTIANITGLWVARNVALGPDSTGSFAGVEECGLLRAGLHYGYTGAAIIGSSLLHYSLKKAADVLGLGVDGLICCDYDEKYQVRLDKVEEKLKECRQNKVLVVAIVGLAGATETGSVDDLTGLAALAKSYGTHFHVDAAWGGPCLFSQTLALTMKGIEQADSVTIDGHKQLFMPMGCGMLLLKDPEKCHSVSKTASYIIRQGSSDLGRFTLEGSRPGSAIYMHANLSCIGAKGYEVLLNRSVRVCRYMAKMLRSFDGTFEVLFEPMMNILLYRYVPLRLRKLLGTSELSEEDWKELDDANCTLQERQKAEGRTFVSRTSVFDVRHGRRLSALRVVIGNPVTEEADIDDVIADQLRLTGDVPADSTLSSPVLRPAAASMHDDEEREKYWLRYWERMPEAARLFFMDDAQLFRDSLVAPAAPSKLESG
eukprot:TRINITY_DN28816_c0_g1_i1.p1 TRINITY_DN28816_c0_g1~~TRINITY_DN28816_c0_g1_i1.p1  ORF type:complete len:617 (-),score=101.37 TRINITY_DN28816_c0_g1_i1:15-1865(-)